MTLRMPDDTAPPSRVLPLLYFTVAYASLALAFAVAAFAPRSLSGFYYHPRLIGVVHLVTLGWITSVALGLVYIALPLMLRIPLRARQGDYWAFASFAIGLIGMVSHFWIEEFGGMAWSGLMVTVAIAHVGARVVPRLLRPASGSHIALPLILAFGNVGIAASAGVVLGFDKVHHFLPGYVVANVLAHAHLAAIGWAAMVAIALTSGVFTAPVVGSDRRRSIAVTSIVLEFAALGLAIALMMRTRWAALFAALAAVALVRFARDIAAAQRRRRPDGPRPDVGGWHVAQACLYAVVAAALGLPLAWMAPSALTLQLALAYGVCGLVGFLAQCLLGVQMRLVPLAFAANPNRPCAVPAFMMLSVAVPLVAAGFFADSAAMLAVGGAAGCAATMAMAVQGALVVNPIHHAGPWLSWRRGRRHRRGAPQQLAVPPAPR